MKRSKWIFPICLQHTGASFFYQCIYKYMLHEDQKEILGNMMAVQGTG